MSARVYLPDGTGYEVALGVFRPLPGQPAGRPSDLARILTSHAEVLEREFREAGNHDPDYDCTAAMLVAQEYQGTFDCDLPPETDDPTIDF